MNIENIIEKLTSFFMMLIGFSIWYAGYFMTNIIYDGSSIFNSSSTMLYNVLLIGVLSFVIVMVFVSGLHIILFGLVSFVE